ncbi:MAG: hypothetical protein IPK32_26325 [Verrucomicrobiaceae bacterium]|nr:hypothetical protein [Verrucomicrobiaceae bacterium]
MPFSTLSALRQCLDDGHRVFLLDEPSIEAIRLDPQSRKVEWPPLGRVDGDLLQAKLAEVLRSIDAKVVQRSRPPDRCWGEPTEQRRAPDRETHLPHRADFLEVARVRVAGVG